MLFCSRQGRTNWAGLLILAIAIFTLVGCDGSNGETVATPSVVIPVGEQEAVEAQPRDQTPNPTLESDDDEFSDLQLAKPESSKKGAASEPIQTATPIPTAQAVPTVVPTPTEETVPGPTASPEQMNLVLRYPDIPEHFQTLIEGERNTSGVGENANAEPYPYVTSITCEDPMTIRYVRDLMAETGFQDGGQLERDIVAEIGEVFWDFSWKNGSIEIGYPTIVPPCETLTRRKEHAWSGGYWHPSLHEKPQLYMRTSDESGHWGEVQALSVPFEVPTPTKSSYWYLPNIEVASNGDDFVIAKEENSHVSVWMTDDLIEWNESIVPLPPPTDLHPVLHTTPMLEQITAGESGWLARVTVRAAISVYRLLPDDITEDINWSPPCSFDYSAYQDGESGITVCWYDEESIKQERFIPWDDLNMDRDTFGYYGSNFGNKPYLQSPNLSGWVWPAKWDSYENEYNGGGWVELPYVGEKLCCELLSTDAGYLALTIPWMAGYSPIRSGTQVLFFSSDGHEWSEIDTPTETHARSEWWTICEESYFFIQSIEKYEDKILVTAENSYNHWNGPWPTPKRIWIMDSDGTNWKLVDAYECEE